MGAVGDKMNRSLAQVAFSQAMAKYNVLLFENKGPWGNKDINVGDKGAEGATISYVSQFI